MGVSKARLRILTAVSAALLTLAAVEALLIALDYHYRPLQIERRHKVLEDFKSNPNDARVTHAFEDQSFVFDPVLIWRPKKGMPPFNEQGFRGPAIGPHKDPGEKRVFAVGDSNTLGWAGAHGSNWPEDLQVSLGEAGEPFLVVNAGVYGYSSYQGLRRFKEVLNYQPDLVLVSFGSNDAHPVAVTDAAFVNAVLGARAPALSKFRLGQLFLSAWESIGLPRASIRTARVPLAEYDAYLTEMARLSKERGIGCVFLTRPYVGACTDPALWKTWAPDYRSHTIQVARGEGVPLVDLYKWFENKDAYFADESHFRPEGHRLAAEILRRELSPLLNKLAYPASARAIEPLPDRVSLNLGEKEYRPSLGSGFSGDERNERGGFVWNEGPTSLLMVSMNPGPEPYSLTIDAACFPPLEPVEVDVSVNGRETGRLLFGRSRVRRSLSLPPGTLAWGPNSVLFRYSRIGRPTEYDGHAVDARQLAIQFFQISVEPAS